MIAVRGFLANGCAEQFLGAAVNIRLKSPQLPKMLVWRMSEGSTTGEWVEPAAVLADIPQAKSPKATTESWASSSFDLMQGCDVSDDPDTVPGDLLDELFAASGGARRTQGT